MFIRGGFIGEGFCKVMLIEGKGEGGLVRRKSGCQQGGFNLVKDDGDMVF